MMEVNKNPCFVTVLVWDKVETSPSPNKSPITLLQPAHIAPLLFRKSIPSDERTNAGAFTSDSMTFFLLA